MPFIKICGLTNLEDAAAAAALGADLLGFIFYPPSKRAVTVNAAQQICAELRRQGDCPQLVGVFVNETPQQIASIMAGCQLDLAQLSGDEPPARLLHPASPLYGRSYKAIRPRTLADVAEQCAAFGAASPPAATPSVPTLLLDAYHDQLYGGTGETVAWQLARHAVAHTERLMLAGGLTPDNVQAALDAVQPFAVDVASGVESAPGKKDLDKLRRFIECVQQANAAA